MALAWRWRWRGVGVARRDDTLALAIHDALDSKAEAAKKKTGRTANPHHHPERRSFIENMKSLVSMFRKSPKRTSKLEQIQLDLLCGSRKRRKFNGDYESDETSTGRSNNDEEEEEEEEEK